MPKSATKLPKITKNYKKYPKKKCLKGPKQANKKKCRKFREKKCQKSAKKGDFIVLMLICAHVERFSVSNMHDLKNIYLESGDMVSSAMVQKILPLQQLWKSGQEYQWGQETSSWKA